MIFGRSLLAHPNAVRNSDSVIRVAGQIQAGMARTISSIRATRCWWPTVYCAMELGQRAML